MLLLAVIQLFEEGVLLRNEIAITPQLVATFQQLWSRLVTDPHWQPRMHLPFYHLSKERKPFWHLQSATLLKPMLTQSLSPKSLSALSEVVDFAYLDEDLYRALLDPVQRETLRALLMKTYFPQAHYEPSEVIRSRASYLKKLEDDFFSGMAAEPETEELEEVRGALFKQQVPKLYHYTCAISGLSVVSTTNASMVDACHIQPWSMAYNDTIQNGICLTPTLHRAFDRGLIGISNDYRVILSPSFTEDRSSAYALGQFEGKPIALPKDPQHAPDHKLLDWHRNTVMV